MLSTLPDTSLTMPTGYPPPAYGPAADPTAGGVDFVRLWHAVRRQWLPALGLGILLGPALAAACWFFLPRGYEAVAWLRVRSNQGAFAGGAVNSIDYQQYRKTQLELIKSPFVLTAALRQPGISSLSMLADEKDPVDWLARHLQVSAPSEAEVVQVKLRGPNAREVTQIVNAVTKSYLTDVISKEKTERLARRDMLERKYKENMAEVRSRLETFNNLARSVGSRDSAEVATQRGLLLDHLSTLRASLVGFQRDLSQIETELALLEAQARGDVEADSLTDDMVNEVILRHPQVSELNNRLTMLDETIAYQIERSRRGANDPAVRRMVTQREELGRRIEELVETLRPQLAAQAVSAMAGKGAVRSSPAMLRMRRDMLTKQIESTTAEFDQVASEVTALGNANADLEARRNEIEQLQQVTNQMGVQLNTSEVDIAMPNRVELLEDARVPGDGDQLFRIMLTVLSGIAGFAAGAGLVVAFEYLRDRLAAVDQVPQRLGLRVLGTVPRISRSARKPNVGQVAESVDGVRTIIAQTGREAPKVILVTSAMAHEGKTTFAAQFAASLARAGHRTLLLDGDLRHPNVHLALGLDLRAGLPELLRGELTADEAVQPTGIEGLFAVTGGGCDYASITALARPDTVKLLKHFRDSFDHVVVDAGPVHAFADVLLLGQQSDAAIVVTMRDTSRLPLVAKAVDRLRSVGIRVLGTVINGVSDTNARQLYASPVVS
jgi:succinoglycan biosynthesis transport protein ExoP